MDDSTQHGEPSSASATLGEQSKLGVALEASSFWSSSILKARRLWGFLGGSDSSLPFPGIYVCLCSLSLFLILFSLVPQPLLGTRFQFKYFSFYLPLERLWCKWTRPFTNFWVFVLTAVAYVIALSFFVRAQSYLTPADSFIGCTASYWLPDEGCGLNGVDCLIIDNSTFDFRCPAQCSHAILQNPRAVGAEEPVFVPLIVGGGGNPLNGSSAAYRGDSFICAAALHA